MDFKKEVAKLLQKEKISGDLLEVPPNPAMGDYALPCFSLVSFYQKPPQMIAREIAAKIQPTKIVPRIIATGPYLNFFIDKGAYNKGIIGEKQKKQKIKKTIVIEFSSPNIMKPFSIAHLRSTMIGNSLEKIYKRQGYKTVRINHLGDWGTQFGKEIYAFETWGDRKRLKKEPIKYLLELYVKYHKEAEKNPLLDEKAREWFQKLEKGDKKAIHYWKEFRNLSLKEYNNIYKRLNVSFDSFAGESFYQTFLKDTLDVLKRKNLLEESEGALVVNLEKYNMAPCIIQKSDGSTIYATRDLAAAIYRAKKYKFDECLYVVDARQSLHFQQVFRVLDLAGFVWAGKCKHIPFGLMKLGEDIMSTREGKVVFLDDVLDKASEKVAAIIEKKNPKLKNKKKVAEQVGIGAIIFWDLSHDRIRDINFDWSAVLDFEGETGPYVQYTHARAASILRKGKRKGKEQYEKLVKEEEAELIKQIGDFQDALNQATQQYKPSIVAKYSLTLCQRFNEFYQKCPVLKEEDNGLAQARLHLVRKARDVMKESLSLLGMEAPEEM